MVYITWPASFRFTRSSPTPNPGAVPAQINTNKRGQVLLNSEVDRLLYELGTAVGHACSVFCEGHILPFRYRSGNYMRVGFSACL